MNRRGILVKLELADKLSFVLGDRVRLQQVILNLTTNAADGIENGERDRRELVICSAEDGMGNDVVSAKDCGMGIDSKNSRRLFDSFFTTKPDGMGMGLAIFESITEALGGRIWASPNPDVGSKFHFTATDALPSLTPLGSFSLSPRVGPKANMRPFIRRLPW
jgi:C4-dicarboxylate-specific signal transduction histidine kinase